VPDFEQMVDAFSTDESADEEGDEFIWRRGGGGEAIGIDAALVAKEFFWGDARLEKSLFGFFGKDEDEIGEIVFFDDLLAGNEEAIFPALPSSSGGAFALAFGQAIGLGLAFVSMPSGDLDDAWDSLSLGFRQGPQTFTGPSVEEIVRALSGWETSGEFLGGGSIESVFFCAVIILATQG